MEKRLPLALILSLAFLLWYLSRFKPPDADPAASPQQDGATVGAPGSVEGDPTRPPPAAPGAREGGAGSAAGAGSAQEAGGGGAGRAGAPVDLLAVSDAPELSAELDSDDTLSSWTTRGAALVGLKLRDFVVSPHDPEPLPVLGLVDGVTPNLLLRDLNGRYGLDQLNWELVPTPEGASGGTQELLFRLRTLDGLLFTRRVRQPPTHESPHAMQLELSVTNEGTERSEAITLVLQSARGVVDEEAGSNFYGRPTALAVVSHGPGSPEVVRWSAGDLDGDPRRIADGETLLAAGCMTTYFASVLVPDPDTLVGQVYPLPVPDELKLDRHVKLAQPTSDLDERQLRAELAAKVQPNAAVDLQLWVPRLDPGATQTFGFQLYSGPKDLETAALPGYEYLDAVIESSYGNFAWINRAMLQVLRTFHGVVGNWGVSIILLTLLVKGLLFPLNRKQQTSMARYSAVMQRLKPQLDELKAKYKNNMRTFTEEQSKLVRAEGASPPIGGCLLMFLQLPVWVGLFQILGTSIELRQSHFVGWIDDLSRPDRMPFGFFGFETINLLPLLMSAATMVQMRFQPKPADPAQAQSQKIMGMIMPIVMLFFLYGYSAGLSLYIFTSSLISIFEFHVIRRIWPMPGTAVPARPS